MNFDETARLVFSNHTLSLLAAGGCAKMIAQKLPDESRLEFEGFHTALRAWRPTKSKDQIIALYEKWWPRLTEISEKHKPSHPSGIAMSCASLQIRSIIPIVSGVLPRGDYYDTSPEDFIRICRSSAKSTSLSVTAHRFRALLAAAKKPWPELCELSDKMLWETPIKESKFSKHLKPMVLNLASGAEWSFVEVGSSRLLRVKGPDATQSARLKPEELEALSEVFPFLSALDA